MSLRELSIAKVCEHLPQTIVEDIISSMSDDALSRLKQLLFKKIWAVYLLKRDSTVKFLGAYSTRDNARKRYESYMQNIPKTGYHKNIPIHRITVLEYTLEASKGSTLYRAISAPSKDFNFGILPITNDTFTVCSPIHWAYPGGSMCITKDNIVELDIDVEKD